MGITKKKSWMFKKLDQETWLCRTHLDAFLVDFGPYWTNLDIFGPFCLLGPVNFYPCLWDLYIWTRLFGPVSLDPYVLTHIFKSFFYTHIFVSISLDHSDWTHLIGLAYLDQVLWNNLGEPVYMDPSNHGVRKVYHGVRKVYHG